MKYQKVSFIKDIIPDIDDVDNLSMDTRTQPKFSALRNKSTVNDEYSGMGTGSSTTQLYNNPAPPEPDMPYNQNFQFGNNNDSYYHNQPQNVVPIARNPSYNGVNNDIIENLSIPVTDCRSIYDHIITCPICKKFYMHDNTIFLILIAILIIICALLLKKVLRV